MFFQMHMGPGGVQFTTETPNDSQPQQPQQEPEYMQGPEGEVIINKKELLLNVMYSNEAVTDEEISRIKVLTQVGWVPYSAMHQYSNPRPVEDPQA